MPTLKFKEAALLIGDRVKREAGTKKATIDGVFDRIFSNVISSGT
jgi:hypothetical protein